ncbi:hypothetical protein QVD17_19690 [Tagetes erecta]|uniref:RRM domain-containing protein n=1 Tax=Tagetes erecta TaxID=13708 RepID=A0AAD8KNH3_TARER|nr:hypothetical protein QVD17_19690 [Tagetes erecta]
MQHFRPPENGGWSKHRSRHSKKREVSLRNQWRPKYPVTSLYITNIPEGVYQSELKELFKPFEDHASFYLARKKNNLNNIFGFGRYYNVSNSVELISSMGKVSIDVAILEISVAMYHKWGNNPSPSLKYPNISKKSESRNTGNAHPLFHTHTNIRNVSPNMSFKDILNNSAGQSTPSKTVKLEPEPTVATSLLTLLWWDGEDHDLPERLAWIRIRGVPAHLWAPETFDLIGNCVVRVVQSSGVSVEDVACLPLLLNQPLERDPGDDPQVVACPIATETKATIDVGQIVGMGDLKDFEPMVHNIVSGEETKCGSISKSDLAPYWGNDNFDFDVVDSVGRSGGIWLKDTKIKEDEYFTTLSNDIQHLESILETRDLMEDEQWIYSECKMGLLELEDNKS